MMDDIFSKDPAVTPKATLSTGTSTGACKRPAPGSEEDENKKTENCKKKRLSGSQEVLQFLGNYVEAQKLQHDKEMKERKEEHNDKMQILKALVDSLSKK